MCPPLNLQEFRSILWDKLRRAWANDGSEGFDRFNVFFHDQDDKALVDMGGGFGRSTSAVDDGMWTGTGETRLSRWLGLCKNFRDRFCRVVLVLEPDPAEGELLLVLRKLALDGTGKHKRMFVCVGVGLDGWVRG